MTESPLETTPKEDVEEKAASTETSPRSQDPVQSRAMAAIERWPRFLSFVTAILIVGFMGVFALTRPDRDPQALPDAARFVEVEGMGLQARLDALGADTLMHLTEGDGAIDILLVATPGCSHCRTFMEMEDGLTALAEEARARGLDLAYMPSGVSGVDIALGVIGKDLAGDGMAPLEALGKTYGAHGALMEAFVQASQGFQETSNRKAFDARIDQAIRTRHTALGGDGALGFEDVRASAEHIVDVAKMVYQAFGIGGTPSFLIQRADGRVVLLPGRRPAEDILAILE